jgi:hypothetical protein
VPPRKRYRCRYCGAVLPGWLPVAKRPDGAVFLNHLSAMHPEELRPYLACMATEDIATGAVECYDMVEESDEAS